MAKLIIPLVLSTISTSFTRISAGSWTGSFTGSIYYLLIIIIIIIIIIINIITSTVMLLNQKNQSLKFLHHWLLPMLYSWCHLCSYLISAHHYSLRSLWTAWPYLYIAWCPRTTRPQTIFKTYESEEWSHSLPAPGC